MQKTLSLVALSGLILLAGAGCAKDLRVNELDGKMEKTTATPTNTMMNDQNKNDEKNSGSMMKNDSAKMEKDTDDNNEMKNKDIEVKAVMDKKPTSSMMKEDDTKMMKQGTYQNFSSDKLALAKTGKVILFFKAGWCPTCEGVD